MKPHLKMIVPLLGYGITLADIDQRRGFRGVFSYDINRPSLDNHIFLIYSRMTTGFSIERDARLKSLPSYYSRREIRIKGITFLCYTFVITDRNVRRIKDNVFSLNDGEKMRIFKFWNFTDDDINYYMLHPDDVFNFEQFEQKVIPEWDYIPDEWDYKESLTARDEQSGFYFCSFYVYKPR